MSKETNRMIEAIDAQTRATVAATLAAGLLANVNHSDGVNTAIDLYWNILDKLPGNIPSGL